MMKDLNNFMLGIKDTDTAVTEISEAPKGIRHALKIYSQILFWIVIPFIPLYLSLPYQFLFYSLLSSYLIFFFIMNKFIMHYSFIETVIFLLFFIFCVFFVKSLRQYELVDEKDMINMAVSYGING